MLARRSAAFGMPCPLRNRLQPARAAASSFSVTRPILSSEVMECGDKHWVALRQHWPTREGRYRLLATCNLYRTGGLAASPGSCRIIPSASQKIRKWEERNGCVVVDVSGRSVAMTEHAVVIAGGGPTGMMLAAELALAEVDVVIVERRATPDPDRARAGGLHARTIEVLDQRGVADRFLKEGKAMQIQGFGRTPLDISDFPSRFNYGLALPQVQTERLLSSWVNELGVPTRREREVTGFVQDDTGVDVALSDGQSLRAQYLVGCDGGRSLIRKEAGIEFAGWGPSTSWLMAEVEMVEKPQFGLRPGGGIGPVEGGDRIRLALTEAQVEHTSEPTLQDVSEAFIAADGTDYGVHSLTWTSRFTDNTRQAVSYRKGRILLAGDAAHVHAPLGGQGLNTGVQDAVNLGWKLGQVVKKTSPQSLLDTYHDERHPVGARVLRTTMAQVALTSPGERHQALRDIMSELLSMDGPRKRLAGVMSGLDIHYDLGEG